MKFFISKIDGMNYQIWDCITSKDSKVDKWFKKEENRRKIIKFTKTSFFKTYPLNFNSSNMNPIKSWLMGCQIAAINVQSEDDDYTLINHVFFNLYRNVGYILKPSYLREGKLSDPYNDLKTRIEITFISAILLNTLLLPGGFIRDFNIQVTFKGDDEDEKENKQYTLKKLSDKNFNIVFNKQKVVFYMKNIDFGFILFKLYDGNVIIGRSVIPTRCVAKGFRNLSIYSNNLKVKEHALISCIVEIHKE